MKSYAGIGSRRTPDEALELIGEIAVSLARLRWTVRSGAAPKADTKFERAAISAGGEVELYLPWSEYGNRRKYVVLSKPSDEAYDLAERFHPAWQNCQRGARALHARNGHIILGPKLNDPVSMIICWTPQGKGGGGTGQALRLADHYEIPVFDLGLPEVWGRLSDWLTSGVQKGTMTG